MQTKEGDIFKSVSDHAQYIVRKVVHNTVILESLNGKKQVLTGVSSLNSKLIFQKKEGTER